MTWVMDACRKVKKEMIVICFSKCEFNEATLELFIADGTDAEFAIAKLYLRDISSYLNQDEDAVIE